MEADGPRKCAAFTESLVADLLAHFLAENVAALRKARFSPVPFYATHLQAQTIPFLVTWCLTGSPFSSQAQALLEALATRGPGLMKVAVTQLLETLAMSMLARA